MIECIRGKVGHDKIEDGKKTHDHSEKAQKKPLS